ncbi:MAG: Uma2 family endonuclease [Candidatus Xenobia bacterium]
MALAHANVHLWTVEDYHRLFEVGILKQTDRVELLEGVIVQMAAQGTPHFMAINHSTEKLVLLFHETHHVACQCDIDLPPLSSPEPDFFLWSKKLTMRPRGAAGVDLMMEVADSSLAYDRHEKASAYAKVGIAEYWILNVKKRQLEIHRDPQPDPKGVFGFAYGSVTVHAEDATVAPLCRPEVTVRVVDLL